MTKRVIADVCLAGGGAKWNSLEIARLRRFAHGHKQLISNDMLLDRQGHMRTVTICYTRAVDEMFLAGDQDAGVAV